MPRQMAPIVYPLRQDSSERLGSLGSNVVRYYKWCLVVLYVVHVWISEANYGALHIQLLKSTSSL
jgi:hypothetical protein